MNPPPVTAERRYLSMRLNKVLDYVSEVHSLCGVLSLDFGETVINVHSSLQDSKAEQSTNISDKTLQGLEQTIAKLKEERKYRFEKFKATMLSLSNLWNLMDTPEAEQINFLKLASVLSHSELEISQRDALSLNVIDQASHEVERLTKLKSSRMKELVIKKRSEYEELCRLTHIEPDTSTSVQKSNAMIDSGLVDPSELLGYIEGQILKAKEEALSRKEMLDRIDHRLAVFEEENWHEDYNRDGSRYTVARGAHLNLKRAEQARVAVTKIPAMVDNLISRTLGWCQCWKIKLFRHLNLKRAEQARVAVTKIPAMVDNLISRTLGWCQCWKIKLFRQQKEV